jgi:hypothetical protein
MRANRITVKLVGLDEDNGTVQFEEFTDFCESVSRSLRKAESLVSGEAPRIRYRIAELGTGSATITLEAAPPKNGPDHRKEVLRLFDESIQNLQVGRELDPRVDYDALEAFRQLAKPLRRRTKEVWVGAARLTTQFEANIEAILTKLIPSEGSVSGFLERVNVHNRYEFVLFPPIPGYRITCKFPESMLGQVRDALKRNVTVSGSLHFQPESPFPHRVHVTKMELHPPDTELPTLSELKGMAPDCTRGLSSIDFLRAIRDEQAD